MIDELLNGDAFREFQKATNMVAVVVSRNQVIDLFEAGIPDSGHDAIRVAHRRRPRIPRIDENRLPRGRNIKLGIAPLDIHHIDVQRLRRPILRNGRRSQKDDGQQEH